MALFHVLSSAILFVSLASAQQKPSFCRNFDCPAFELVREENTVPEEFEIRNYTQDTYWVATSAVVDSTDLPSAVGFPMFKLLLAYIQGANSEGLKIPMTAPVVRKIEPLTNGGFEITTMFYLTSQTPPLPTDEEVYLVTKPAGEVFVRSFEQQQPSTDADYNENLAALQDAISDPSQYGDVYYRAGYNSPFYPGRKHYEVWLDRV